MDNTNNNAKSKNECNEQRLFCYMDILGYKDKVEKADNDTIRKIAENFKKAITDFHDILSEEFTSERYHMSVYSDSIMIHTSKNGDITKLEDSGNRKDRRNQKNNKQKVANYLDTLKFLCAIKLLFNYLVTYDFLPRGAIVVDQHYELKLNINIGNIVVSKALIEAYKLEDDINYPMILVDETIINYLKNNYCNALKEEEIKNDVNSLVKFSIIEFTEEDKSNKILSLKLDDNQILGKEFIEQENKIYEHIKNRYDTMIKDNIETASKDNIKNKYEFLKALIDFERGNQCATNTKFKFRK